MSGQAEYQQVPVFEHPSCVESSSTSPYDVKNLDRTWRILLEDKLHSVKAFGGDQVDSARQDYRPLDEIDGRGTFTASELEHQLRMLPRSQLEDELGLSPNKIREILRRADIHKSGEIDYKVFLETVKKYRLTSEQASKLRSIVAAVAYAEEFSCHPPTVFMLLVTLIETAFFLYHVVHLPEAHNQPVTWEGPVPYCSVLIYNPRRRWELWRYMTYMCVHIGISHFIFNMLMQIVVGVFLEMQQEGWIGSLRVMAVYLAGVLAASLGTSLSDPHTYIAGASGGVYALIAAHLATLALNWQEDSAVKIKKVIHQPLTRIVRLVFIITLTVHDIALAIYVRCFSDEVNTTGFMGHLCGALAGLLVGIFVLENRRVQSWEPYIQWISIGLFSLFIGFAIIWNIFGDQWYKELYGFGRFFSKPNYELYTDQSGNCKHYEYL